MTVELTLGIAKMADRNVFTFHDVTNIRLRDDEFYIGQDDGYFCVSNSMVISMQIREESNGGT